MSYHHLSRKERGMIALWENNRVPRREIARRPLRSAGSWPMERERGGTEQMRPRNVLSCVGRPATVRCAIRIRGSNNMCGKS